MRREKQIVNMPRQSFNIREDEQVSVGIRKYPCLFDKSNSGYMEKDRVENAWKEIDNLLETEEGFTLYYESIHFYFMIMITNLTDIFQFPKFTSG